PRFDLSAALRRMWGVRRDLVRGLCGAGPLAATRHGGGDSADHRWPAGRSAAACHPSLQVPATARAGDRPRRMPCRGGSDGRCPDRGPDLRAAACVPGARSRLSWRSPGRKLCRHSPLHCLDSRPVPESCFWGIVAEMVNASEVSQDELARYYEALGPIRDLVLDESLTEVMVNGYENIYVE